MLKKPMPFTRLISLVLLLTLTNKVIKSIF